MSETYAFQTKLCFPKMRCSSSGLWLHESPLSSALPLLMVQIGIIVVFSRILHAALRPFSSPAIVSQALAGILLGPSLLGRIEFFRELFDPTKIVVLKLVGVVGLILFQFMIGVKIDFGMLRKTGKKALAIGLSGHLFPAVVSLGVYHLTKNIFSLTFVDIVGLPNDRLYTEVFTWSVSSIVVVANLLDEMNLLNSKIGKLAIAASLVQSALAIVYRRLATAFYLSMVTNFSAVGAMMLFLIYVCCIIFIARPIVKRIVQKTPQGMPLSDEHFIFIIVMLLVFSLASFEIGQDIPICVFLLGLALPSGPPLGSTLSDRLEGLTSTLTFPVFIAIIGLRVDYNAIYDTVHLLSGTIFIDLVTLVGKIVSVVGVGYLCHMPLHDCFTLAIILCAKGITEMYRILLYEEDNDVTVGEHTFTMMMSGVLVMAFVASLLLKIVYKPSKRYQRHRRRTVLHASNNVEFRILSCVHTEDHVSPGVNLLASLCSHVKHPICIYLLCLIPLVGRVAPVLVSYRKDRSSSHVSPTTDHIVSAFSAFEKKYPRYVTVQPYVSNAPYSSMYDDICDLALDKKTSMILLPFHQTELQGSVESTSEDVREVNRCVLRYAPCSVAIFVDHGFITDIDMALSNPMTNVVVYFIGGPDDREALALAMRMALNIAIAVTVIRFRLKDEVVKGEMEEKLDSDIIYEFTMMNVNRSDMVYREEMVEDGEEMVGFLRTTSQTFDLIMVGRREGQDSALTEGLSMWSEFPELGLIGDLLASKDFGSQVSTLVVQQQQPSTSRHTSRS